MFGIVSINGHQYKVVAGQVLDVEKIKNTDEGKQVDFADVLMVNNKEMLIGKPFVTGAKVVAKIIRHDRSRKLIVLRRRPGKYIRKNGHRQNFTSLLIMEIHDGKGGVISMAKDNKNSKKYL